MSDHFDPNVSKVTVFSAAFRRKFFEPSEPPFGRPFAPKLLIPSPPNIPRDSPEPFVSSDGREYFRLSDVKALLEADLQSVEAEVHANFLKELSDYIEQHRQNEKRGNPLEEEEDLPSLYS
jgi:hypothetical protein